MLFIFFLYNSVACVQNAQITHLVGVAQCHQQ